MKTIFAAIGTVVFVLWLLGAMGIGHFTLVYGPEHDVCANIK